MAEAQTLYKLIVLSMLDRVDFPLTNAQISDFILTKEYTNYFTLQQVLSELVETELAEVHTVRNSTYYHITEKGKETLTFFGHSVSSAIQEDITKYLKDNATHPLLIREHQEIISCLRTKNIAGAKSVISEHINKQYEDVIQSLKRHAKNEDKK